MGLFSNFYNSTQNTNIQNTNIQETSTQEKNNRPDYQECKEIYTSHALGKRLVNSIIDFSMSSPRKITIKDAPLGVVERYQETLKKYNVDNIVKQVSVLNRVYGVAGLFVSTSKTKDDYKNLSVGDILDNQIYFNVLDPLNLKFDISQNPLSPLFLKPSNPRVGGRKVGGRRVCIIFNGTPIFLQFEASGLNFTGRSVFKNMLLFLETWRKLFVSLERIALKASSILITKDGGKSSSDAKGLEVAQRSAELVKSMQAGQVAYLLNGEHAEFFNLNGASEIGAMIKELKMGIAMALDDTPASILLDKELSNGLSEGSEDMKAVIMKVANFRTLYLNPIYDFIDSYLFYKAWGDDFINEFLKEADHIKQYAGKTNSQIRNEWISGFSYEWESVYPKTPDEETREKDGVLDRLLKAKELGADSISLQDSLNDSGVFDKEFTIENQDLFSDAPLGELE